MDIDQPTPELPVWLEALQYLQPDQVNVLAGLAEGGEAIADIITEAVWEKLEQSGALETYRKEPRTSGGLAIW
jgi:hypothetical protein